MLITAVENVDDNKIQNTLDIYIQCLPGIFKRVSRVCCFVVSLFFVFRFSCDSN